MNVVNLTPHAIAIEGADGTRQAFSPSGLVARVATERVALPPVGGFRVTGQDLGDIDGLPGPVPGTIYLVSGAVLQAFKDERVQGLHNRRDVFAPDTGLDAIRDHTGQIVAVLGLVC